MIDTRRLTGGRVLLRFIVLVLSASVCAGPVMSQSSGAPTKEEIIERLKPRFAPEDLRSNAVRVEGRRPRAEAQSSQSIDLAVNFEYASARLTPDARIVLDNLGQALADAALRDSRFRIAGHTDARGSDAYNLVLSRQRARSVADYLMHQHYVDAKRLVVEGFGRRQLLDAANPESAVNRRVEVTNLGQ